MKKTIAGACMCAFLSGCGIIGESKISPEYKAYLETELELRKAFYKSLKETPRAKIKLPAPNGGEYEFVTYDTPEWVPVEQEAPSEWAPVVKAGVSTLGAIGTIYAVGSVAESIMSEAVGSTYNTGGGSVSLTNVGNKNIAAGSGTHSIYGHENPTTHLILQPE